MKVKKKSSHLSKIETWSFYKPKAATCKDQERVSFNEQNYVLFIRNMARTEKERTQAEMKISAGKYDPLCTAVFERSQTNEGTKEL